MQCAHVLHRKMFCWCLKIYWSVFSKKFLLIGANNFSAIVYSFLYVIKNAQKQAFLLQYVDGIRHSSFTFYHIALSSGCTTVTDSDYRSYYNLRHVITQQFYQLWKVRSALSLSPQIVCSLQNFLRRPISEQTLTLWPEWWLRYQAHIKHMCARIP
jgi:hypothetical protein